jgi:hypothetical protein
MMCYAVLCCVVLCFWKISVLVLCLVANDVDICQSTEEICFHIQHVVNFTISLMLQYNTAMHVIE